MKRLLTHLSRFIRSRHPRTRTIVTGVRFKAANRPSIDDALHRKLQQELDQAQRYRESEGQ